MNIEEAIEDQRGYCTTCQDIVDTFAEPDAENYKCPECGEFTVMGVENAVIMGELV